MTSFIQSNQNPTIKQVSGLLTQHRQRIKQQRTVIEGIHLIDACFKAQYPIEMLLIAESAMTHVEVMTVLETVREKKQNHSNQVISVLTIADKLYKNMRTLGTGIDIMAVIPIINNSMNNNQTKNTCLDTNDLHQDSLILNDVQDSGNVGTLLRTASAVGIKTIFCTSGTASSWSPKTLRAGMGAQFSLTIYENLSVDSLLSKVRTPLLATSSHTDSIIYQQDLTQPVAWIMGHEGQGVCKELMSKATPIALPQPNGQESLNVAVAGALCMYEMLRQRQYNNHLVDNI